MSQDVSDFINKLNATSNRIKMTLPSTGKTIEVKPLSLKQQKDIISCVGDGVAGLISFTRIINDVVTSNTELKDLTQHDKLAIILKLRANSLGSKYKYKEDSIDISEVVEKLQSHTFKASLSNELEFEGITVQAEVPSLSWETEVTKKLEDEIKRNGDNNSKNIGSIYIYELIKHIKSVSLGQSVVNFSELKLRECVSVVESIPLALNKKVVSLIDSIRKEEQELLTINGVTIEINPGFFDAD
jgi:hypothetical protein